MRSLAAVLLLLSASCEGGDATENYPDPPASTPGDTETMSSRGSIGQSPEESLSKIARIDASMATIARHQAEDPAKVQRLITECQARTGAVMEGEGALLITECVNNNW